MNRLNNKDLLALISAIGDLNADFDPRTLPGRALSSVAKVVDADSVTFTGIKYNGELSGLIWDNSDSLSPGEVEIFGHYIHEQPLFSAYLVERRTDTLKITDLVSPAEFERTGIYNEFYRRVGVKNQLVSPLPISTDSFVTCSINTAKPDFSERDKTIMNFIAPHLIAAIRNAFAYERLSTALDTAECGVVAIDSNGKTAFVSEFARQLFDKYFASEKRAGSSLPETLWNWLNQSKSEAKTTEFEVPLPPFKIANEKGELTVRRTYNRMSRERTLLLEEKRFASSKMFEPLQMTKREAEILFWITQGKTDGAIAEICGISPRTVHKHVENIYTKLGVETRTAAMLKALEIM